MSKGNLLRFENSRLRALGALGCLTQRSGTSLGDESARARVFTQQQTFLSLFKALPDVFQSQYES